jgi:hypothetical protein
MNVILLYLTIVMAMILLISGKYLKENTVGINS